MTLMKSSFRMSVASDTRGRAKSVKKSFWFDRFKIPKDEPTAFALIFGEYRESNPAPEKVIVDPSTGQQMPVVNPYYKFRQHKRAMMKNGRDFFATEVCSAGTDPHNPQPCCGCSAQDSGDASVTTADQFALGIVHLAYYHGHPLIDENGQIRKKQDGSLILGYDPCEGRVCNYCRVMRGDAPVTRQGEAPWPGYNPQDLTTVFGRRKYIEIGKGHLSALAGWDTMVNRKCFNEGCGQITKPAHYSCPNCQSVIIDMSRDTRDERDIEDAVSRPYPCMKCQQAVFLKEVPSCRMCEAKGMAASPQLGLFEVVLLGMRQGEGTNSKLVLAGSYSFEEYQKMIDPRLLNGKSLRQHVAEIGEPYDFSAVLAPKPLAEQAKRLDLPMPAGQSGGQQAYQNYGNPQQPQQGGPGFFVPPSRPNYGR